MLRLEVPVQDRAVDRLGVAGLGVVDAVGDRVGAVGRCVVSVVDLDVFGKREVKNLVSQ